MDIQITGIEDPGDGFLYIQRTIDGGLVPAQNKMPRETLAIRAAEYNIAPDDPRALDMLLMESYIVLDEPEDAHPLHRCDDIDEALEIIGGRIDAAKTLHNAPKDPRLRSLFHAADLPVPESTQGLTDVKATLLNYCDDSIPIWVKVFRDEARKEYRNRKPRLSFLERIKMDALTILEEQAKEEDRMRSIRMR